MHDQTHLALLVEETVARCFSEIRYARAAELARVGRYLEAEAILAPNGRLPNEAKDLDLLARIAAQQKNFVNARRLWQIALQLFPEQEAYKLAISHCDIAERSQQRKQKIILTFLCSLTIASLLVALTLFLKHSSPEDKSMSRALSRGVTNAEPALPPMQKHLSDLKGTNHSKPSTPQQK